MLLDLFCEKCTLQFDTLHVFDLHLSLVHGEKIRSKNEPLICEENFQEPKLAERNVSDHLVANCLKCNICDFPFNTKQYLKDHIRYVHEGKKSLKCNVCDANFTRKVVLARHVESVHDGKKPFKCDTCGASFTSKETLNIRS